MMTVDLRSLAPPARLKALRIGVGFLPWFLGSGLHSYRVTRDPLPNDARVVGCYMDADGWSIVLHVESADFPALDHGSVIPSIEPVLTEDRP